jgi:hypothetical protein
MPFSTADLQAGKMSNQPCRADAAALPVHAIATQACSRLEQTCTRIERVQRAPAQARLVKEQLTCISLQIVDEHTLALSLCLTFRLPLRAVLRVHLA